MLPRNDVSIGEKGESDDQAPKYGNTGNRIRNAVLSNAAVAQTPDWRATPRCDTVNLGYNFSPDPYKLKVQAGGSGNAETIAKGCAGFIDITTLRIVTPCTKRDASGFGEIDRLAIFSS